MHAMQPSSNNRRKSNTPAGNATTKQHLKVIFLSTKGQYMKESNTLAGNVGNNSLKKEILLNTKGKYMKESSMFAGNVTIK